MKTIELQLITVGLEDGKQGIFVGWPLVPEDMPEECGQVENIWFSNVQAVPNDLTLEQLMELVRKQHCDAALTIQ